MIAAIYTVLCLTPVLSAIAYGPVQVRIAEALTLLPLLWKPSIWGVTIGCFLSNLIGAATGINPTGMLDAVWGTIATFGAAYCTWLLRDYKIGTVPVWSCLMPVIWNFFIIGAELAVLYMPDNLLGFRKPSDDMSMGDFVLASIVVSGLFIAVFLNLAVNLFDKKDVK